MADDIEYKIHGDDVQLVQILLDPGEAIVAEAGTLLFKDNEVAMSTDAEGWMMWWLKRIISGESFFITSFTNTWSNKAQVAFAAPYPWKIIALDLKEIWWEFLCQKDSFLCAAKWIDIAVAFTKKIGAWLFWGEWFILQKLSWDGLSFIHAWWAIVKLQLQEWQSLQVDTWCLVGFSPTIDYDIKFVWGFKNALFWGEWLFLADITWPWLVYIQSLPFSRIADRIIAAAWNFWRKWDTKLGWIWDITGIVWGMMSWD